MSKEKEKVFAVFGLGNFGQTIAMVLAQRGATVIAIDNNAEIIDACKNKVSTAILIDSTDERAMAKAPLDDVGTAIIAMDDMETSIITTMILKDRGIPYIICRAVSPIHAQVLRKIGVNEVINLQQDEGIRVAKRLVASDVFDAVAVTSECSITEIVVPALFVGKNTAAMALREKFNLQLAGIMRVVVSLDAGGNPVRNEQLLFPDQVEKLSEGDILIILGKNYDIEQFKESV